MGIEESKLPIFLNDPFANVNKKIDNTQFNKDFEKLEKERLKSLEETIKYRKNYLELSKKFDDEMRDDRIKQKRKWDICNWFKT